MYLLIYAVVLLFFWVRALRITPMRYESIDENQLMDYRYRLLKSYQRYGGFFLILFLMSMANGFLAGYSQNHPGAHIYTTLYYAFTIFIAAVLVGMLIVIIKKAFYHHKQAQALGLKHFF